MCSRGQEAVGRQSYQDMDKWSHNVLSGFSAIILHTLSSLRLVLLWGKERARCAAEP